MSQAKAAETVNVSAGTTRAEYRQMTSSKAPELTRLQRENEELKKLLGEAALDRRALQDSLETKRKGKS